MNNNSRRMAHRPNAQGMVEFALILPILLMLLMGIIDFGWLTFNYVQLQNGLREALRYGSVPSFASATTDSERDCPNIYAQIINLAPMSGVKASQITVYYDHGYSTGPTDVSSRVFATCDPSGNVVLPSTTTLANGDRIRVDINANVRFLTPFFSTWVRSGLLFQYRGARTLFPSGVPVG